jgi:hypothetical protein
VAEHHRSTQDHCGGIGSVSAHNVACDMSAARLK